MRKHLFVLIGGLLATTLLAGDFTKTMTAEELAAAGLAKLSEAELAQLKASVERYKTGVVAETKKEAEKRVAAAEEKVRQAEAKQPVEATGEKKPSWLKALITLGRTEASPDKADAFETRIKGQFTGWRGKTVFTLENGQRWQQINAGEYSPPRDEESPRVKIYPGSLGSYWLEVEGHRQRVRVKPLSLQ